MTEIKIGAMNSKDALDIVKGYLSSCGAWMPLDVYRALCKAKESLADDYVIAETIKNKHGVKEVNTIGDYRRMALDMLMALADEYEEEYDRESRAAIQVALKRLKSLNHRIKGAVDD